MNIGRRKFRLWLEDQTHGSRPQIVGYHNHCSDCPLARFLGYRVLKGPSLTKWANEFIRRVDRGYALTGVKEKPFVPITSAEALQILDSVK